MEATESSPAHPTAAKVRIRLRELGIDADVRVLRRFERVWCAAGTPHAVFEVETEALLRAAGT